MVIITGQNEVVKNKDNEEIFFSFVTQFLLNCFAQDVEQAP